jgi:hypothetical protein
MIFSYVLIVSYVHGVHLADTNFTSSILHDRNHHRLASSLDAAILIVPTRRVAGLIRSAGSSEDATSFHDFSFDEELVCGRFVYAGGMKIEEQKLKMNGNRTQYRYGVPNRRNVFSTHLHHTYI